MAYDKVIDSSVLDGNLTSVANAIREKAGLSDNFAFPQGFIEAISGIGVGFDFFNTAYEIKTGSLTFAEDTIVGNYMTKENPFVLDFTNGDNAGNAKNVRYFLLWAYIPNENRSASLIKTNHLDCPENTQFAIFQMGYEGSGANRFKSLSIYRNSSGSCFNTSTSVINGDYNSVYSTDTTRFFGGGIPYYWVAWTDKSLADY